MQTHDMDWKLAAICGLVVLVSLVATGRTVERDDEWRSGILSRCAVSGCQVNQGGLLCREPDKDCEISHYGALARVIRSDAEWMEVEIQNRRYWTLQAYVQETRR